MGQGSTSAAKPARWTTSPRALKVRGQVQDSQPLTGWRKQPCLALQRKDAMPFLSFHGRRMVLGKILLLTSFQLPLSPDTPGECSQLSRRGVSVRCPGLGVCPLHCPRCGGGCWQGLGGPLTQVLVLAGSSLAEESGGERMELSGVIKSLCPSEQTVLAYTIIALGFSPGCHGTGWRQL